MTLRPLALAALATLGCAAGPEDPGLPQPDGGGFIPRPDAGTGPTCRGNRDGVIERDEVAFVTGVTVRYRVNPSGTLARVAPAGEAQADGARRWDFSDRAGDTVSVTLLAAPQQWFASSFSQAQYAAPLDPRAPELGVYLATDAAVQLLGVAGPAESDDTLVRYDAPLDVLRFPLSVGMTWTAEATTQAGRIGGTPVASRDRYEITVDARGAVVLPELTFPDALRIRVELTQRFPAGPGRRRIQYLWMTECYGEVARMVSQDDEADPAFTLAAEFRRLGL